MKQEALHERMELLEVGEALGYPRLGYGRSTKIPHDRRILAGKESWEKFAAHAHIRRLLPALRISRVLRDNHVIPYNPPGGRVIDFGAPVPTAPGEAVDLLDDIIEGPQMAPLPRPKKGGHKKPPRPGTKRWLVEQERLAHG